MYIKRTILASSIALLMVTSGAAFAAKTISSDGFFEMEKPMIEKAPDGLFVTSPVVDNLIVMIVSVYNADGEQVLRVRSKGEPVELLASGLADGNYSYSVKTLIKLDQPAMINNEFSDEVSSREAGRFIINSNEIKLPITNGIQADDELSYIDNLADNALALLGRTLSAVLPEAVAQNLTAGSSTPTVFFDDTGVTSCCEWSVVGEGTLASGTFSIRDLIDNNVHNVVTINGTDDNASNENSWVVQSSGTMSWSNGGMHLNNFSSLGLGTGPIIPAELAISSLVQDVRLMDETDDSWVEWELNAGRFRFQVDNGTDPSTIPFRVDLDAPTNSLDIDANGNVNMSQQLLVTGNITTESESIIVNNGAGAGASLWLINSTNNAFVSMVNDDFQLQSFFDPDTPLSINMTAPDDSLVVSSAGNLGIGTSAPAASINVVRNNGTALLLVEETSATPAPRTLFRINNNGNTRFGVNNTQAGVEWAFANPGTGFRLSRQGSGVVEMEIFNNGNMEIAGALTQNSDVNTKTAITKIDPQDILKRVVSLPVSQWEYKDARGEVHIGPMAQDFYAAFGLGATETGLSTIDTAGVALVAIQALDKRNQQLSSENIQLKISQQQLLSAYHNQEAKLSTQQADLASLRGILAEQQQLVNQLLQSHDGKALYTTLK